MGSKALVSGIPLQRGAHLEITLHEITLDGRNTGLDDVLSSVSATHLLNLQSPTSIEYHPDKRSIRLFDPNGSFSFSCPSGTGIPFAEFPLFPLANIREFRLIRRASELGESPINPITIHTSPPPRRPRDTRH